MSTHEDNARFIDVSGRRLHYVKVGPDSSGTPLVFLHEGLGSVELWRAFPGDVSETTRHPGLVYSRHGNGWSSPLAGRRRPDYMHEEALDFLPRVVGELVGRPPILVGHSDGASIALIYAGSDHPVEALVLIAPHVFVEPETLESIGSIRDRFPHSDMPAKMARYHADPDSTFYGWADIWLDPRFREWNIEQHLAGISAPTLLIQGDSDEYGTLRQLDAIDAGLANPTDRVVVEGAGHSPHLSHPELVVGAVVAFVRGLGR